MTIIQPEPKLGDSLTAINAILARADIAEHQLHVCIRNQSVRQLLPYHPKIVWVDDVAHLCDRYILDPEGVRVLSAFQAMHQHGSVHHIIQSYYAQVDLAIPVLQRTRISFEEQESPSYDYIISPYSVSDWQGNKEWPMERWQDVINTLGGAIAVLGASGDPRPFTNVTYEYGHNLTYVCNLLKNVKHRVATIDNGISHLTYAVGAPHTLLYPQCLSATWVNNPEARIIQGVPSDISVAQMLALLG